MTRTLPILTAISGAVVLATGVAIAQQITVDINRICDAGVGDKT
jgi:hypothetical protein